MFFTDLTVHVHVALKCVAELDLAELADYLQGNSPDFPRQVIAGFEVSLDHLPGKKMVQHQRSFLSPRGKAHLRQ